MADEEAREGSGSEHIVLPPETVSYGFTVSNEDTQIVPSDTGHSDKVGQPPPPPDPPPVAPPLSASNNSSPTTDEHLQPIPSLGFTVSNETTPVPLLSEGDQTDTDTPPSDPLPSDTSPFNTLSSGSPPSTTSSGSNDKYLPHMTTDCQPSHSGSNIIITSPDGDTSVDPSPNKANPSSLNGTCSLDDNVPVSDGPAQSTHTDTRQNGGSNFHSDNNQSPHSKSNSKSLPVSLSGSNLVEDESQSLPDNGSMPAVPISPSITPSGDGHSLVDLDQLHQSRPLSLTDCDSFVMIHLFKGGKSPQTFRNGLLLHTPSGDFHYTIAEAPCQLRRGRRLKPLDSQFKISFRDESIAYVRCFALDKPEKTDLKYQIDEVFETDVNIVAVLLINPSDTVNTVTLDPRFQLTDDFVINIPVYTTSYEYGQDIFKHISDNQCSCEFEFMSSDEDDHRDIPKHDYMLTALQNNPLLEHLQFHLFNKTSLVSGNPQEFQVLASAFANEELLTKDLTEAATALDGNLHKLYKQEFIFLIFLVSQLIRYKDNVMIKTKAKSVIEKLYDNLRHYLLKLEVNEIAPILKRFHENGDFEVMVHGANDRIAMSRSIFHCLHTGITRIINDYKDTSMSKSSKEVVIKIHLQFLMKWITVAIKFRHCSHSGCNTDPRILWTKTVIPMLQEKKLTSDIVCTLTGCISEGAAIDIPYSETFIGSGCLQAVLQRNGRVPRSFDELNIVLENLHTWIRSPEESVAFFCLTPRADHISYFCQKDLTNYIAAVVGKDKSENDVVVQGFQYIDNVARCLNQFEADSTIYEAELKKWITFLLRFLDIIGGRNFLVVKQICSSKNLFSINGCPALSSHFIDEMQTKAKEHLTSFNLKQFISLCEICKGICTVEIATDFFKAHVQQLTHDSLLANYSSTLSYFSNNFRVATAHSFLVDYLLIPLSKIYAKKEKAEDFIMHLVQLDIQHLLAVRDQDDFEVVKEFSMFLRSYISKNKKRIHLSKPSTFSNITNQLKSVNKFKRIVLDVIAEELYSTSTEKRDEIWLVMLEKTVNKLRDDMKQGKNINQHPLKFYWQIVGGVCEKLELDADLPSVEQCHILLVLGPIDRDLHAKIDTFTDVPDIKAYQSVVIRLKRQFNTWKVTFTNHNVIYNELTNCLIRHKSLKDVADKFGLKDAVVDKTEIQDIEREFVHYHQSLSSLLIKSKPQKNWISLHTMLPAYQIDIPENIMSSIRKCFYFPGEKPPHAVVQCLPPPKNQDTLLLHVRMGLTYHLIVDVHDQLSAFLDPLKTFMPLLEYFHLEESKIFNAMVKTKLPPNKQIIPAHLAVILESVSKKLVSILTGEAIYEDISGIISDIARNPNVFRHEIRVMRSFHDFQELPKVNTVNDFEDMLILHQVMEQIDSLCNFCEEFQLQQCLNDKRVIRLREIAQEKESWQKESINAIASRVKEIKSLLHIDPQVSSEATQFEFLKLFKHLYTDTKELRIFLNENNFRGIKGQDRFQQLLALVTQALQHEEYNTEVLTNLYAVYYLLVPLNNPDLSFDELLETVSRSRFETSKCLAQLRTVNGNIDLIRMWFSKAEGDTVANTFDELRSITTNGKFNITVSSIGHNEDRITLTFQREKAEASGEQISLPSDSPQSSHFTAWNVAEIQDFIRRLGFANPDNANADVKTFMELNELVVKMQRSMESLHKMGHPNYSDKHFLYVLEYPRVVSEIEKLVVQTVEEETKWSKQVKTNRRKFKWLSFFTNCGIIRIYKLLQSSDMPRKVVAHSIFKQLRFLMSKSCKNTEAVLMQFENVLESVVCEGSPTEMVGFYLNKIFETSSPLSSPASNTTFRSHAVLHQCHKYSPRQLIQHLYSINKQIPKSYEILRCHSGITFTELQIFFQRIEYFPRRYYFLQVDLLSSKLQEHLLQLYMELYEKMFKSQERSTIHFIETSSSLLHNAPYINTVVNDREAMQQVQVDIPVKDDIQLVYGLQGNGKTHYIRKQLTANRIVIAVNEAFSIDQVIAKLDSLTDERNCSLYFNFTLTIPGNNVAEEERDEFKLLMDQIGWFMFDLLVLGYVKDQHTGVTFSGPVTDKWNVFIEVPSISTNPDENLTIFREYLPTFSFIGTIKHITSDIPYDVDDDVQLVCKYLNALKTEQTRPGWGINKLFFCDPIRFGDQQDFDDQVICLKLLDEYMPEYIRERKISQKLFIKYMKKRCQFLDNFPAYNFNQGRGSKGGDTTQLGSTLMNAMLKEVPQFCDPSTKEDWSLQAHQQLIYEQQDGGSIGLITLYPDQMPPEEREAFEKIELEIPSMGELYKREVLDKYLARGLSLPLSAVTEIVTSTVRGKSTEETRYKRLKIIDDNNYVLTLDYALKMINIHERRECGMPVIIEGETGVGKTELLKMLSKLWNYTFVVQLEEQKQKIVEAVKKQKNIRPDMSLRQQVTVLASSFESVSEESTTAGQCNEIRELSKIALELKKSPLLSILQLKHMTEDFWSYIESIDETSFQYDTKKLFRFLRAFSTADVSTFHKLNVHSGLKPADIINFFDQVNKQAAQIKSRFGVSANTPQVTAYLDEINTSSCMGLFKEIIVDRSVDGKPILDNIFIIAACNPLRGDSTAVLRNMKNVWLKPNYYVRSLHPTIDYLKWDYGALNDTQENEYVTAKMNILTKDAVESFTSVELTYLIVESQIRIREYANKTLTDAGYSSSEARRCSRSCVSQRDMQRVFDFYKWLFGFYKAFQRFTTTKEQQVRAVLVSLGLVYYLRLGERDRQSYASFLNIQCRDLGVVSFTIAFNDELEWYIERLTLPPGIAKTTALKENVFANIACCQTHTPLIIIGEPGTSKTLSFNLVTGTFKGRSSDNEDFKKTDHFRGLQPFFYQCSQHTNSKEVENLFMQAIGRQNVFANSHVPTYCVVFMDEAGLPEERHESLKVLHYHLDRRQVSFVAITNHALDAAKTNRAISLYRPETSTADLTILASDLLRSTSAMTQKEQDIITSFCSSFSALMKVPKFQHFYGQRDFMHFVSFLRRRRGSGLLTEEIVLQALERNFNGHEDFVEVFDYFLKVMEISYNEMVHRNILEMFGESLQDLPQNMGKETNRYKLDEAEEHQVDSSEQNVRYKLIIDTSEDDSAARYLFACDVLNRQTTQMIACSDFPEESGMHINTIAKVIHSAEKGNTIVMFQTDQIHESFYELFNQRFRVIDDPQKGIKLFTNISIGAHTKPCRVHSQFQCVVVIKKSELKATPQAFLSRFEKFFFSYNTLYDSVCESKPPNLQIIITNIFEKVSSFVRQLHCSRSFYGYSTPLLEDTKQSQANSMLKENINHETLYSLLLSLLPSPNHIYETGCAIEQANLKDCKDQCLIILVTALNALQVKAGWNIPQMPIEELQFDSKAIFEYLLKDPEFSEAANNLQFDLTGAVGEALDAIHSETGRVRIMGEDSCLVIAVIVQWLVRYVTKHLLHLLTPEALVVNAKLIPKPLMKEYFEFQEHFSLSKSIQSQLNQMRRNSDSKLCASKLLVYTRQSYLIGSLPSTFPSKSVNDSQLSLLQNVIHNDLDSLKILKVSPDTSEGEIEKHVAEFMSDASRSVFLLTANMKDVTVKMINYLRTIIEQQENQSIYDDKLVVILLHFPQIQFFKHCYPALFLSGWDHIYLDSLTTNLNIKGIPKPLRNVVDIKQCFRIALHIATSSDEVLSLDLEPLLGEAIPIISSRVIIGSSDGEYNNKSIHVSARQKQLMELFVKECGPNQTICFTAIGKSFCSLFHRYWDRKTVTRFLEDAAHFTFRHQSTLSITRYIQTRIRALFFEFTVYLLWKINEDCNLDTFFSFKDCTEELQEMFGGIIVTNIKVPSLATLSYICHSLPPPEDKKFQFPFFSMVYHRMEELLDSCQEIVNKKIATRRIDPTVSVSAKATKDALEKDMFEEMRNKLKQLVKDKKDALAFIVLSLKNEDLWQKYLQDFINSKCSANRINEVKELLSSVIAMYFGFDHAKEKDPVSLLAWVHVHSEIHKTDLTQTTEKLHRLKAFITQQPHETLQDLSLVAKSLTQPAERNLGTFIVQRNYESLKNSVKGQNTNELRQWYLTYRDTVQIESLYNSLHELEDQYLRLCFFKAHTMYTLIHCCSQLNNETLTFAYSLYDKAIAKISDKATIEDILSNCFSALINHNCSKSFISSVIDLLLSFMFHSITIPAGLSSCEWFLKAGLPDSPVPLLEYISTAQYKVYLMIMLDLNGQKNNDGNDVLKIFQPDLRSLIGRTIVSVEHRQQFDDVFFTDASSIADEVTLTSIYMQAVYQGINVQKVVTAVTKLRSLFDKADSCQDPATKCLLLIEREAFMQRFLHLLASNLTDPTGSQEVLLGRLPSQIDGLLNREQSLQERRGLILCMHLWNELKSTEKFRKALISYPDDKFTCLNKYKIMAKGSTFTSVEFSFPLLIPEDSELGQLYSQTYKLMMEIHQRRKEKEELKKLVEECDGKIVDFSISREQPIKIDKKRALIMCVWLCSYYEYHLKNVKSEHLAKAIHSQMEDCFSEETIRLIICFLNKQLIEQRPEQDLPSDPNAPLFEFAGGELRPTQRQGNRVDPVYKLFFPERRDDQSRQMCNALASLVAAILACPDQANHLWYHLFYPDQLMGRQVTGFLFDSEIKEGRLYDCGIVLSEDGNYGRPEYLARAERGVLNLHSLYLLLWSNFGAFCLNLLTRKGSVIKGTVISDYQAIRHYCKSQLSLMWIHMSTNLGLTDEQLSLLTVCSMKRMIQVSYHHNLSGLFETMEQRDDYERMWHAEIFLPSLEEVRTKFDDYFSKIQANDLIMKLNLRKLAFTYPYIPTVQQFTHYVQEHCVSEGKKGQHAVLVKFINSYPRLQAGGVLLPVIIEFYQWIITDLSHVLTKEQAFEMSIHDAVNMAAEKYSKELENHYTKLFEDVEGKYNAYLEVIGFSIGAGACANVQRENAVPTINKQSPVFRFLPGEKVDENEEQRDFLFLVIEDIVNFHNSFLKEMNTLIQYQANLQKYTSKGEILLVHPSAVNEYSCILGPHVQNRRSVLELMHKHQTEAGFDLDKIQEEFVAHYIAGKLPIDDCWSKLRKPFHYRIEMSAEQDKLQHPTELMLTLDHLVDNIDEDFKCPVPTDDDFLTALEYELFSMDYEKLIEVAQGLKTITEHIKQKLDEQQIFKADIIELKIGEVLPKVVYADQTDVQKDSLKVFDDLGMKKLQDTHRARIAAIPMRHLLTTLITIVQWIKDGIYDFHTLPKAMKTPLRKEDEEKLLAIGEVFEETHKDELLNRLKNIVEVLIHCEQDLIKNIDKVKEMDTSVFQYMKDLMLFDDEKITQCLPKCIQPKHYMALRICLRKMINTLEESRDVEVGAEDKWSEYVDDLWSKSKLEHLRDVSQPLTYDEVYDPVTGALGVYGFDIEPEEENDEEAKMEEYHVEEQPQPVPSSQPVQESEEVTSGDDLSAAARKLSPEDIAEYLRYLKMDQYVDEFLENEVDGGMMFDIDNDALNDLGVETKKDRFKIKNKFKEWLREKNS